MSFDWSIFNTPQVEDQAAQELVPVASNSSVFGSFLTPRTEDVSNPVAVPVVPVSAPVAPTVTNYSSVATPTASTLATPDYGSLVTNAYSTLGRTGIGTDPNQIDQAGYDYWLNQLKTGAVTPDTFTGAFNNAAENTYINQAYQDLFGRTADTSGVDYWANSLNTTDKNAIYNAIAAGATGADILGADKYKTGTISADTISKYLQSEPDLLNEYEAFRQYNLSPEQTNLAPDYFSGVGGLYSQNVDKTITDILGANYVSAIPESDKQNIVNQLLTGDLSRSDVTDMFTNSAANKQQEAARIANSYVSMFGGDTEDAKALYAKLLGVNYTGTGKVDDTIFNTAKSIFDTSLTDEKAGLSSLLKTAANQEGAEDTAFFKQNPDYLAYYKDVGDTVAYSNAGAGGQYGYYDGKPILKASEVDQLFDKMGTNYIKGDSAGQLDNDIGWDTGSRSGLEARGAAAFGIMREPVTVASNSSVFGSIPTGEYTYSGDMNGLAQKLGIDPSKFDTQDALYDAINEATKDYVYLVGKTGYDAGGIGEDGQTAAFQDATANHAGQMYQRVGDKYLPIGDTKYFNAGMELSPGSWFSNQFGGIASIPGIAELSAFALPGAAAFYPAIKAGQTAALGGDFGDIAKSGLMAYAGQTLLPQAAPTVSNYLSGAGIDNPIINQALTQGALSGGISTLLGGSGTQGLTSGLIGGGIGGGMQMIQPELVDFAKELGIPEQYAGVFSKTLASIAPTLLTGGTIDPVKLLMNYFMRQALSTKTT